MGQFAQAVVAGTAEGAVLASLEPLSFWGGIDPATGDVIDVQHPLVGQNVAGKVLMLGGSRGSCTGSGVMLDLALRGLAPAAILFAQAEDVVTLGALIAGEMFDIAVPVYRLGADDFTRLSKAARVRVSPQAIEASGLTLPVAPPAAAAITLSARDGALLAGEGGAAAALAMRILLAMARQQGAERLIDVTQAHIDGCIYASPANLTFAERMRDLGARVVVPTTMNAISVDRRHWQAQGVPPQFGGPAARLADAYVQMGCAPSFTCAPYLLESAPQFGEPIAWAESNAVIYANSVLGARTAKHPDFLDLCVALTGRAPLTGVYLDAHRRATRIIDVVLPEGARDEIWPLLGYLAGQLAPDRIPLIRLAAPQMRPRAEDMRALCGAFGTSSGAAMLHVEGVTPEAHLCAKDADHVTLGPKDFLRAWEGFNRGPERVDLVAIGSPHPSVEECRRFADCLGHRPVAVATIITAGRQVLAALAADGTVARLRQSGVSLLADLCWCSISEPVFPPETRCLMTNSGKYAHYGPGLSGRAVRFGNLADCAEAAVSGLAPKGPPSWARPMAFGDRPQPE